jgi:hypothetical protein
MRGEPNAQAFRAAYPVQTVPCIVFIAPVGKVLQVSSLRRWTPFACQPTQRADPHWPCGPQRNPQATSTG